MEKLSNSVSVLTEGENQIFVIDNDNATAKISLFGAHVISYIPKLDNRERLWLSPQTKVDASEVIRGGVPICWPWFSNQFPENEVASSHQQLASHGFLRNDFWVQKSISEPDTYTTVIVFSFDAEPLPGFSHRASVTFKVEVSDKLTMSLSFENTGNDDFGVTGALHSYFQVADVSTTTLSGLSGKLKDKTRNFDLFDTPKHYGFTKETDNVHLENVSEVVIKETNHKTSIGANGHDSYVVWNPGQEAVKSIGNIPNTDYLKFLCVEAAITSKLNVAPGHYHTLQQTVF